MPLHYFPYKQDDILSYTFLNKSEDNYENTSAQIKLSIYIYVYELKSALRLSINQGIKQTLTYFNKLYSLSIDWTRNV